LGKQRNEQTDSTRPLAAFPNFNYVAQARIHHRRKAANDDDPIIPRLLVKKMKLFVTPKGDRWLCSECEEDFAETISEQGWRVAFEKIDPMLRCAECKQGDIEIFD
jgi:hypothetical protein